MNRNFSRFFSYLKENDSTKYRSCAKNLIKSFVTDKNVNLHSKLDNLKLLDHGPEGRRPGLHPMGRDHLRRKLRFPEFQHLLQAPRDGPAPASLGIAPDSCSRPIIPSTEGPRSKRRSRPSSRGHRANSSPKSTRQTLSSLLKDIRFDKKIVFDHEQLAVNYRYILLNVLARETDAGRMAAVTERLLGNVG